MSRVAPVRGPLAASLLVCVACHRSALPNSPLSIAPTAPLPPGTPAQPFQAAVLRDRQAFLDSITVNRYAYATEARRLRTKSYYTTLAGAIVGAAGAIIPNYVRPERTRTAIGQTGSGLAGLITTLVGFHSYDGRARRLEACVATVNAGIVEFSGRWADSAFVASPRDTLWQAYVAHKTRLLATIQSACPVTGRSLPQGS